MYSQKKEDHVIWEYFKDKPLGNLLDIGANDGRLFSNSLWLIEHGWGGVMVEPSPRAFTELVKNHGENPKLYLRQYAITDHDGEINFWDSGSVRVTGRYKNSALVSTIHQDHIVNWKAKNIEFDEIKVPCRSFVSLLEDSPIKKFNFITIDTEGEDFNILKQMDLNELGCQLICIEHDKITSMDTFKEHIGKQGYRYLCHTQVNLLMVK